VIELKSWQPEELGDIHDIHISQNPPRPPTPLNDPGDRIGTNYVPLSEDKDVYVVRTSGPDRPRTLAQTTSDSAKIEEYTVNLFIDKVERGRLPENLLSLQSGVGNVANSVTIGLKKSGFRDLSFYTEVI